MQHRSRAGLGATALGRAVVLVAASVAVMTLATPARATAEHHLDVVLPPVPTTPLTSINGVTVINSHDAWAVGDRRAAGHMTGISYHWDGHAWHAVAVPSESGRDPGLRPVAASSPSDVWAAGTTSIGPGLRTYAIHWNGTAWDKVPVPNPHAFPQIDVVSGISVDAPDDVWLVGDAGTKAWVLHWDGAAWRRVHVPRFGFRGATDLQSVTALSPTDVWVDGETDTGRLPRGVRTIVLHWDGSTWTRLPTYNAPHLTSELTGLDMRSPTDGWAVGDSYDPTTGERDVPLALHWDGTSWHRTVLPHGTPEGALVAVSADASGDAWAAGQATAGDGTGLLLHWTGARWLEHSVPPNSESLEGVSSLSGSLVATVGQSTGDSGIRAIWNGHGWHD